MSASTVGTACALLLPTEAHAQFATSERFQIDISARSLRAAITELAHEAHVSIGTQGRLPTVRTPRVRGQMTVDTALARMLAGSGYVAHRVGERAWRIERAPTRTANAVAPTPQPSAAVVPIAAPNPPIIVTAAKIPNDLRSLPSAVTVVDISDEGNAAPRNGTAMVAGRMEGLTLTSSGSGRNRMFLRGVADGPFSGESQATVAILLDSARITYAAPDPDIRMVDVDRVEVLKGPQGSLYGAGTLGGIYKIVTNRPDMGETSLALSQETQAVSGGGIGFGGSAVANLPIGDRTALRLVGYAEEEAGWVDTGPREDSNRLTVSGGRAILAFEPDEDWRIEVSGAAQRIDSNDSQYVYRDGGRSRLDQLPEPHDNDITLASLHATGAVGDTTLTLDSSYIWHEVRDTFDATIGAEGFGVAAPLLLHDDREYRIWNAEARLDGQLGQLRWLVGLSHIDAQQSGLTTIENANDPRAAILDDDRRTSEESALFGNVRFPLGAQFHVDTGARYFLGVVRDTRLINGDVVADDVHRDGLTPSLSFSWQPRDTRLVFVRYGSALRQGGADIGANGRLKKFESDELETFEVGWREQLPSGGSIELGAFATLWDDVQSDVLQSDLLIETMNVGKARILGLEAALDMDFAPGWHFTAGGTLTDGKLVRDDSGLKLDDRRLPVIPRYTLRSALQHEFPVGAAHVVLGGRVNMIGPARLSFDPLLDRKMGNTIAGELSARLFLGPWDMTLDIDNIFGSDADTFAYGNRLRLLETEQFNPLRPTTATLSIGVRF